MGEVGRRILVQNPLRAMTAPATVSGEPLLYVTEAFVAFGKAGDEALNRKSGDLPTYRHPFRVSG